MTIVEESVGTLDARWHEAEARLDSQAGSLQALVEADRALQELMSALRAQIAELELRLATLEGVLPERLQGDLRRLRQGNAGRDHG